MKNKKWNREFPEVPENVHQSVMDALASLDKQEAHKVKKTKKMKKRKRTVIILAAAAVAAFGTTVAATGIFKWNERAEEVFEAEPQVQEQLVLESVAEPGYQTVSDNGLTISVVQIIQDTSCFYALFEVAAEDENLWKDEGMYSMRMQVDFQGGEDPFSAFDWGFVDEQKPEKPNSRYYEFSGTKFEESDRDLCMNIHFTALEEAWEKAAEGEAVLEGNWDFSLDIHSSKSVCYELNREYQIAGQTVFVQSVELSPLSVRIRCDAKDVKALEEKEGVNLDRLDVLRPMFVNGVKYQDGTVIEEAGWRSLSEGYEDQSYVRLARFSHVIEVEKAAALLLGDEMVEIELNQQ